MFLFSFNNGVFLIYTVFMCPCWRISKMRNMLEMCFLSLLVYQFCFDLILTSCFPQIRMEVALCAASPYTARDKKSFRKYSRAFSVLLSLCWAANIRVLKPSQVATSSVKQNYKGFIILLHWTLITTGVWNEAMLTTWQSILCIFLAEMLIPLYQRLQWYIYFSYIKF